MKRTDRQRVGRHLRDCRLDAGLAQAELAAPHYTGAYVCMIESGRRSPSLKAATHFAKKLGVSITGLLPPSSICKCGAVCPKGQKRCVACRLEAKAARWRERSIKQLRGARS